MSRDAQIYIPGTKPRGPRRPIAGPVRMAGLELMVEHFRKEVAKRARSGDLFLLSPQQKRYIKAAIEFCDELKKWQKGRAR